MTRSSASRPSFLRNWLIWTAGFLAFPIGGFAGTAVAGRVDDPVAALLGGAVAGLVIGGGQALVSSRRLDPRRWIPATTIGMSLGLLLGAATVGYRTSLAELALMGALTGLVLGVAQAIALPRHTQLRWAWAAALPFLWALGWTVTTLAMVTVDEQFTVFGAAGAVTFSALSGLLLHRILPHRVDASADRAPTASAATP
jgi:nitrate reductase gamma subunit